MIAIKKGDMVRFKETSVFCRKHPHTYECTSDEWTVGRYTLIKLSGFRGGVRTDQLEIVDYTVLCSGEIMNAFKTMIEFCRNVTANNHCRFCPIKNCADNIEDWEIKEEFERKFEDEQV